MEIIVGLFILIAVFIALAITFLPVIIAVQRKHNDTILIFLLTFFFGWTFIGWIVALLWSISSNVNIMSSKSPTNDTLTNKLTEITDLLNRNLITQEEYETQKKKILEKN